MYQYYIQSKKYKFEKREGYQLPDGFAACQESGKWVITDVLSGAMVTKGALTLKDAKVDLGRLISKVKKIRKSDSYNKLIQNMNQYVGSIPEKKRVIGWKRYFRIK